MQSRNYPDDALIGQTGADHDQLKALAGKVLSNANVEYSLDEIHVIYSTLISVIVMFVSEEDFYIKLGFFRENMRNLATGISRALIGLVLQLLFSVCDRAAAQRGS
jgi:hypothetical protein